MKKLKGKIFRNYPIMAAVTIGVAIGLVSAVGSAQNRSGVKTSVGSDVSSLELRSITIESFDKDYTGKGYGWEVHTNRDNTYKGKYDPDWGGLQSEREIKLVKGTPRDIKENAKFDKPYILGVRFAFTFPGHNTVTVQPPRDVDHYVVERPRPYLNEQAFSPRYKPKSCFQNAALSMNRNVNRPQVIDCVYGIEMPGIVRAVSVWVNGRGNEYDMEGWIEDWKGDTHKLKFGSLDFVGWRPMLAYVPKSVPQGVNSYPQVKTIVFKKFIIRNRPGTSLESVYLFFDELRVLTDIFEVHFDGAQINFDKPDCETKERLYEVVRRNTRHPDRFPPTGDCKTAPGKAAPIKGVSVGTEGGPSKRGEDKKAPAAGGGGGQPKAANP